MQLPSKLYSYENSTLRLLPIILKELENGPMKVNELYLHTRNSYADPSDFLSVMDCAYALRAVDINENEEAFLCL